MSQVSKQELETYRKQIISQLGEEKAALLLGDNATSPPDKQHATEFAKTMSLVKATIADCPSFEWQGANWQSLLHHVLASPGWGRVGGYHRCLVWSTTPGTGKSYAAAKLFDLVRRVTLFRDQECTDLIGPWRLIDGTTSCDPQLAAEAMLLGLPLIIDEIDQFGPSVETMLNSLCDDLELATIVLPDGQEITPKEGFGIVATTNCRPDQLPERLRDRFDVVIHADKPSDGMLDMLEPHWRAMVVAAMPQEPHYFASFSARRAIAIQRLMGHGYDQRQALELALGRNTEALDAFEASLTMILDKS